MKRIPAVLGAVCGLVGCGSPVDTTTLCPPSGPQSTTVVIFDTSDPLAPHQLAALDQFTTSLVSKGESEGSENYVPKGHLLVVYELAESGETPVETFRMCNPGDPGDRSVLDGFTEGEIAVMVRWTQFDKAIRQAFPTADDLSSAPNSPIIETIRYVRNKEFPRVADANDSQPNTGTLLIVSDMLQNSDLLSHYGGPLPSVDGLPQSFALDLTGIDVGVRYLRSKRDAHLQTGEHFAWWRRFFAEAGGPMTRTPDTW